MEPFQALAVIICLAAGFSYINYRYLALPMTIGLMLISLTLSILLLVAESLGLGMMDYADRLLSQIDFRKVLLDGMLGLLLFAGALHVNINDLAEKKYEVGILATLGTAASTLIVGGAVHLVSRGLGLGLSLVESLLFGALISPTDPIAVLGILKKAGAPKSLETKISGESLFNDGFGVVIFMLLYEIAVGAGDIGFSHAVGLFAKEALGGAVFGLGAGYLVYLMLKSVNNYQVEIMATLALVVGGYTLAGFMHLSAPLAMVLAGMLIGNHGRRLAMSDITREHLDTFWELVDTILNAILFVLIGLEVLVLSLNTSYLLAGVLAVPIILLARLISVGAPVTIMRRFRTFSPGAIRILTWGGLRGGISVALALSIPADLDRELILTMTYVVVVFSVVVQGLTVKPLVQRMQKKVRRFYD